MSALKRIMITMMALAISVVCTCTGFASASDVLFDTSATGSGIKDTDGNITIKGALNIDGGIPVTILVAPQILDTDGETDVTANRIKAAGTVADFLSVVEYMQTFTLVESGAVDLAFSVKDSMTTGIANVYVSYNGGEDIFYIGFFDHVGKTDVNTLLGKFNAVVDAESSKTTYPEIIAADMKTEEPKGLQVLKKIGAETDLYASLTGKDAFSELLYSMKPEDGFTAPELIDSFNEAVAWMQLREENDTLSVLGTYNTVYWNLELGEGSDFTTISGEEQTNVLAAAKIAGAAADSELLEASFKENIALAKIRSVTDRNELEQLLANEAYAEYYAAVNTAISDSDLNGYEIINAYNYVLENGRNTAVDSVEALNGLIDDAIKDATSGGGGGVGGGGGSEDSHSGPVLKVPSAEVHPEEKEGFIEAPKHPFKDIAKDHWASEYIIKMYQDGIINGKTADSFAPEDKINRQDFVKMIVSAMKMETVVDESVFEDVEKGGYYEPFIMTAVKNGVINGISENNFGMSMNIRREDAALILCRITGGNVQNNAEGESIFVDSADIAAYAKEAIDYCVEKGLFKGDTQNRFNPKNGLSRAEAAALISRLLETVR